MPYTWIDSKECSKVRDEKVNELLQKVRKFNDRWYIEEGNVIIGRGKVIDRSYSVYYYAVGADYALINFPRTDRDKKNQKPFNWHPRKREVLFFLKGLLEAYENPPKKSAD